MHVLLSSMLISVLDEKRMYGYPVAAHAASFH